MNGQEASDDDLAGSTEPANEAEDAALEEVSKISMGESEKEVEEMDTGKTLSAMDQLVHLNGLLMKENEVGTSKF